MPAALPAYPPCKQNTMYSKQQQQVQELGRYGCFRTKTSGTSTLFTVQSLVRQGSSYL